MSEPQERVYGWEAMAVALSDMLGTSISWQTVKRRAHPLARFQLPARWNAGGVYVLRTDLEHWARQYDAPHGAHDGLKRAAEPPEDAG